MTLNWNFEELWELVSQHYQGGPSSIHGSRHWARVMENGLAVARLSGANPRVVKLFALFHDSCRENDGHDPGHGFRGGEFAKSLLGTRFYLPPDEFDLLYKACQGHTDMIHHPDPTIGTCWDADRLDLGRVGMRPDPAYFNTAAGKLAAIRGSVSVLENMTPEELSKLL